MASFALGCVILAEKAEKFNEGAGIFSPGVKKMAWNFICLRRVLLKQFKVEYTFCTLKVSDSSNLCKESNQFS